MTVSQGTGVTRLRAGRVEGEKVISSRRSRAPAQSALLPWRLVKRFFLLYLALANTVEWSAGYPASASSGDDAPQGPSIRLCPVSTSHSALLSSLLTATSSAPSPQPCLTLGPLRLSLPSCNSTSALTSRDNSLTCLTQPYTTLQLLCSGPTMATQILNRLGCGRWPSRPHVHPPCRPCIQDAPVIPRSRYWRN